MLTDDASGHFKCQHVIFTVDSGTPFTAYTTLLFEMILTIPMSLIFRESVCLPNEWVGPMYMIYLHETPLVCTTEIIYYCWFPSITK